MTHDTILSRGLIALTLTLGLTATAVRADAFQPLPRLSDESVRDTGWPAPLPPETQPLPRRIEVTQSDAGSLQEALRLLESRVESGAFESAPNAIEDDEMPTHEPIEPTEPNAQAEIPVSVPQPPFTPAPPIAPVPPVMPLAPEPIEPVSVPIETTPKRTAVSPSSTIETPAADPPVSPETATATPSPMLEQPPAEEPIPAPDRTTSSEDVEHALPETVPQTTDEPIAPDPDAGRWQVQLLSGRSLSRVERDRDDILRFHGDRFSGLTLTISRASPNGLYRLRALSWPSQAEAAVWCRNVRAATGLQCMVVRGDESPAPDATPVDTLPSPATR